MTCRKHLFRSITGIATLALAVAFSAAQTTLKTVPGASLVAVNDLITVGKQSSQKEEKLAAFTQALTICESVPNCTLVPQLLNRIGGVYLDVDEMDMAWQYAERARAAAEKAGDRAEVGNAYNAFGWVYDIRGNYQAAIENYEKSLAVRREINDQDGIAGSLGNIGLIHVSLSNYSLAEKFFNEAIELAERIGNKRVLVNVLMNIGNVHLNTGDYSKALMAYERGLDIERERGRDGEALLVNIGMVFEAQGDIERATLYYELGYVAALKVDSKQNVANALVSLGRLSHTSGELSKALELQTRALSIYRQIGFQVEIANTLDNISGVYVDLGKFADAATALEEAIKISRDLGDPDTIFQVLLQKANIQIADGKFEAARQTALLSRQSFEQTGGSDVEWRLHEVLAKANKGSGRVNDAKQNLRDAIAVIERQRLMVAGGAVERQETFGQMTSPYFQLAEILTAENDTFGALKLAEQAKARTLLDSLNPNNMRIFGRMSERDRVLERDLRQEVKAANARASMEPLGSAKRSELDAQLAKKRSNLRDLQTRLFLRYPDLEAQRGVMQTISSEDLRAMFKDSRTAYIEFSTDQKGLLAMTGSREANAVRSVKVKAGSKELSAAVESYRSNLASGDLGFQKVSRQLYDLLLKPIEKELAGKTNIVIVPDGPLWDLPFQALMDERGKYLVEKAAISYAPSLTALREMSKKAKTRKPDAGMELLAFGNPIVGKSTSERVKRVFMSEKLEPLPESERLVNELGRMYGANRSKIYIGNQAREETAKMESPKYRIVQFATHGILNNVSPMYSHLVLAQNENNPNEDGLLEAWEMKDLDLKADMVILSACETARGRISNGEGVIGMSWASFIAGAPTTVASQWKVESSSTTELMLEFHRQLLAKQRVSKAEALRRASLKLMKVPKYKHPSYWAGFVIVGDGS